MRTILSIIALACFIGCSDGPRKEPKKPTQKREKVVPNYYVGFDLNLVDSLSIFAAKQGDSIFVHKLSLNKQALLKSSSLSTPDNYYRCLHIYDSLNIRYNYKFVFYRANEALTYTVTDLDTRWNLMGTDGTAFSYISRLSSSKINGIKTHGLMTFEEKTAIKSMLPKN